MRRWVLLILGLAAAIMAAMLLYRAEEEAAPLVPSPVTPQIQTKQPLPETPSPIPVPVTSEPSDAAGVEAVRSGVVEPKKEKLLVLVHADGTPATGAKIVVFRDEEILHKGKSDEQGEFRFPVIEGKARIAVGGVCYLPHVEDLAVESAVQRIQLKGGAMLGGVVLVDGAAPASPLYLSVDIRAQESSSVDLPPKILSAVSASTSYGRCTQESGPGGRFLFSQMPEDWSGAIHFPGEFRFANREEGDSGSSLSIPHPSMGIVIALLARPAITGRAVSGASALPLAGASLSYRLTSQGSIYTGTTTCSAAGRFRIPLMTDNLVEAQIDLVSKDQKESSDLHLKEISGAAGIDVGDVRLNASRELSFLVREPEGAPVLNARAGWKREDIRHWSEATDGNGSGRLLGIPGDLQEFEVGALGYFPVSMAIPSDLSRPVTVILTPSNRLEVWVLDPEGKPFAKGKVWFKDISVEVAAKARLFRSSGSSSESDEEEEAESPYASIETMYDRNSPYFGVSASHESSPGESECSFSYFPDNDGRVLLVDIRPGVAFDLRIQDEHHNTIREEKITMGEGERVRVLRYQIDAKRRDLSGTVLDARGKPVEGAKVSMGESRLKQTETDGSGQFKFSGLLMDRTMLSISHPRFVAIAKKDVEVPPSGASVNFVLRDAAILEVRVEDEQGVPAPEGSISGKVGDVEAQGRWDEAKKLYLIEGLPLGECDVVANLGGRGFLAKHSPNEAQTKIVIPAFGSLSVKVRGEPPEGSDPFFGVQWVSLGGSVKSSGWEWISGEWAKGVRVPVVFPGRYRVSLQDTNHKEPVDLSSAEVEVEKGKESTLWLSFPR